MADKKPSPRGELRRRHRLLLLGGSLGRLGSEGRLMACYALYWADFEKCTLRMSIRGAAKVLGVSPNGVRRGLQQLLDEGVLILVAKGNGSQRSQYELASPGHEACALRTRSVTTPVTPRDRSAHVACTERTRSVYGAHTLRDPYRNISIGIQGNTNRDDQSANPPGSAGEEPADRAQEGGAA